MARAHVNPATERVVFNVEVQVPFHQAAGFAAMLTGNDDDVVLSAERAIRGRMPLQDVTGEEVELFLPRDDEVKAALREASTLERRTG